MKNTAKNIMPIFGLLALILDAKTAATGVIDGLELCFYTVIPAIFPFIFLSSILLPVFSDKFCVLVRPITKKLGMPSGSEGILLVGLLGGYPSGAACIASYYQQGKLDRYQAERLLGFCNNAGPAFIFGMGANLFSAHTPWILWGIHLLSAFISGSIIPCRGSSAIENIQQKHISAPQALMSSIRIISGICGWVVLFKVVILFCEKWFLWILPKALQALLQGILELSNGCCSLYSIENIALRFILFSVFLAMGGFCIFMQTATVASNLSLHWYLIGKLIQGISSLLLSIIAAIFLFPVAGISATRSIGLIMVGGIVIIVVAYVLNNSRFSVKYNI